MAGKHINLRVALLNTGLTWKLVDQVVENNEVTIPTFANEVNVIMDTTSNAGDYTFVFPRNYTGCLRGGWFRNGNACAEYSIIVTSTSVRAEGAYVNGVEMTPIITVKYR